MPDDESDRVTWRNGRVINNIFFPDAPAAESANADESVPNRFGKSRSDLDLFMGRGRGGSRSKAARGARRAFAFASRRGPDLMAMESSRQGRTAAFCRDFWALFIKCLTNGISGNQASRSYCVIQNIRYCN